MIFRNMTFHGFVAQLIVGMMSRYKRVETVAFDICRFKDYQRYACVIRYSCRRLYFNHCEIDADIRDEFISFFFGYATNYLHLPSTPNFMSFYAGHSATAAPAA